MNGILFVVAPMPPSQRRRFGRLLPITTATILSAAAWIGIFWSAALLL